MNEFWKAEKIVDLELAQDNLEKIVEEAKAKAAEEAAKETKTTEGETVEVKKMITDDEAAACSD